MTFAQDHEMCLSSLAVKVRDGYLHLLNHIFNLKFPIISDLQNVNITLRILFRPVPTSLPNIYSTLGIDYDERVLPSITNEILKAVVVS